MVIIDNDGLLPPEREGDFRRLTDALVTQLSRAGVSIKIVAGTDPVQLPNSATVKEISTTDTAVAFNHLNVMEDAEFGAPIQGHHLTLGGSLMGGDEEGYLEVAGGGIVRRIFGRGEVYCPPQAKLLVGKMGDSIKFSGNVKLDASIVREPVVPLSTLRQQFFRLSEPRRSRRRGKRR